MQVIFVVFEMKRATLKLSITPFIGFLNMLNHSVKISWALGTSHSVSGSANGTSSITSLMEIFLAVMESWFLRPSDYMSSPCCFSSRTFLPGNSNSRYLGAKPTSLAISLLNSHTVQLV